MPAPENDSRPVEPIASGRFFDLSTDRVPARQRQEFWCDTVLNRSDGAPGPATSARDFSGQIRGFIGDRAELRDGRSDAVTMRRNAARCREDGGDEILLSAIVSIDDTVRYRNNAAAFTVPAGRFLINDLSVPFEIAMPRYRAINFRLPRAAVARGVRASPSLLGGRLLTETPLTSLLFGQLVRLADTLPEMDDPARQVALDATADFAIAALRLETRAAPWDNGADRSGLWLAAERFIARHLDRADLGPDLLARALRCSRTQLYRLFARHDVTVMDHIRETRLARCHEMLTDPACKLPIAEIAALCGMDNPSAFSRGFRRRFGRAPGEIRRQGRQAPP